MRVQKLIQPGNPACATLGRPQPGAAFLTHCKYGSARAGLREAGKREREGKTNQLHRNGVRGFPSTMGLGCISPCPESRCPLQRCSGVAGVPLQLSWHFATCSAPFCPLQKEPHLSKTPCSPCGESSLPSSPRGWYHYQRSCAMCCHVLACHVLRQSQLCFPITQKPSSSQDPAWFCG